MPAGDKLLRLADELGVEARWLATGEGPVTATADDPDWVSLPRYDLLGFAEYGKPDAADVVRLRRDLLGRWGSASNLWLATMPSDATPEIAREGDLLLCSDPAPPLMDGRVYAFRLDGRLLIRRVQFRAEGLMLKVDRNDPDPIVVQASDVDRLYPIARILAAIVLQPV
jgi:hypothetical protein